MKKGDLVFIPGEKRPYRIRATDGRYAICTKPLNLKGTVLYFIYDAVEGIRGPDNMVFCFGYETDEDCDERLKELQEGKIEISMRNRVPWDGVIKENPHGTRKNTRHE